MRKFLLICMIPLSVSANTTQTEILCASTKTIMRQVSEYKELPIVMGVSTFYPGKKMAVFVNRDEQSYTILILDDKIQKTCVIDNGVLTKTRDLK